jgi:hypothetical protein
MSRVCPACEKEIGDGKKFCKHCGAVVSPSLPALPPADPQAGTPYRRSRGKGLALALSMVLLCAAAVAIWAVVLKRKAQSPPSRIESPQVPAKRVAVAGADDKSPPREPPADAIEPPPPLPKTENAPKAKSVAIESQKSQPKEDVTKATTVDPPMPATKAPEIVVFEAVPDIAVPQCEWALLRWTVNGESSIAIDHGVGDSLQLTYVSVRPLQTTTYSLKATGPGGAVDEAPRTRTRHRAILQRSQAPANAR